jgi:type IV secretory pathway VirB2 component (pilin)
MRYQHKKLLEKLLILLALTAVIMIPETAFAAPWDTTATKILDIFTGGLTRTIAIIAVIACGIAAIAGKLSWDWAIKIIVGIILIFGAASIVDYIIAGASA